MDISKHFIPLMEKLDEYLDEPLELIVLGGANLHFQLDGSRGFSDIDVYGDIKRCHREFIPFIGKEILGSPYKWLDFTYSGWLKPYFKESHKDQARKVIFQGKNLLVKLADYNHVRWFYIFGLWNACKDEWRFNKLMIEMNRMNVSNDEIILFYDDFSSTMGEGYETMGRHYLEVIKKNLNKRKI